MSLRTIIELAGGWLRGGKNEVFLDAKQSFDDPVKYRGGAWSPAGWLVIVSGDVLSGDDADPRRNERGFFGIRHDDDFPKTQNAQEFALYLTAPNLEGDAAQRCALRLTSRYLEVWGQRMPIPTAPGWPSPVVPPPSPHERVTRLWSGDGRYCWNTQSDDGGKIVQYDTWQPGTSTPEPDEARWRPVAQWRGTT